MKNFEHEKIPAILTERLSEMGFKHPTPIQEKSIPLVFEGKDVLGSAQTGTGKTAAYGVPAISHLLNNAKGRVLILLPTRELAMQVCKALNEFMKGRKIRSALLIGGEDIRTQIRHLKDKPARLIVGTPGRVNDHMKRKTLKLGDTDFLVLDEVDRMLDMGFGIQLESIIPHLKEKRQTLMFSATLPKKIESIAAKYLNKPERISVGSENQPASKVKQSHIKLSDSEKPAQLLEELDNREGSIIVFVKTKFGADKMAVKLKKAGHKAEALHGDLRQSKRAKVISGFRSKKNKILVATDVAARGLDIPHIEHVINYDLPHNPEDYIHRIGRTARAGAEGEALNFLSPSESKKWRAISRLLNPELAGKEEKRKPSNKRKGRSFFNNNNSSKKPRSRRRKPSAA